MAAVRTTFLRNLAAAFLSGAWTVAGIRAAGKRATGERLRWVTSLAQRLLAAFPDPPEFETLLAFLDRDAGVIRACGRMARKGANGFALRTLFFPPSVMRAPPAALGPLAIPSLATEGALAAWLGIDPGHLRWCADLTGRNRKHPAGPLRTYRHRWVPKPVGRARLLEIPRRRLKEVQRRILDEILNAVPPHAAAHGFRPAHSAITNAAAHCGRDVVIKFDLTDFFPSVPAARVYRTFRTVGYPETVARLLTGLCTTRLPWGVWDARPNPARDGSDHSTWQRLGERHLPQGAPTSPAIANLVAYRLDRRLTRLAAELEATYTRYADDLTFSGGPELARGTKRLARLVAAIAADEGFTLNFRKTRVMRRGTRQTVTGLVVNAHPNVPRAEYELLKAILTNCVRHGPATQNREKLPDFRAHLAGKVSRMAAVNPVRGRKLWGLFDKIVWENTP